MKHLKAKLSVIAIVLTLAIATCGIGLLAFAAEPKTGDNTVDANGWNTQVTRGGDLANAGHQLSDDNFTTYTNLQDGDVVTFGKTFTSLKDEGVVRTLPWRLSLSAEGTGSVTWQMKIKDTDTVAFAATWTLGGSSFDNLTGMSLAGGTPRTLNSGDKLELLFDGNHSAAGSAIYYVDNGVESGQFAQTDPTTWENNGSPTEFDLEVSVSGAISSLSVKAGEGLLFQECDASWTWVGYNDGYGAASGAGAKYGIHAAANAQPKVAQYFVFKGYEFKFHFVQDKATSGNALVTVGGTRVDADKIAPTEVYTGLGYYTYTVPQTATSAMFNVKVAEHTITYKNGSDTLLETYVDGGDLAYDTLPASIIIPGKFIIGWTTDAEGQNDYDFTTPVSGDLTLYAKLGNAVAVKFYNGATELSAANYRTGDKITAIAAPSDPNRTFKGWYADEACTQEFDFNAPIASDVVEVKIYAAWLINMNYRVLGFAGNGQGKTEAIDAGTKVTAADLPTFAEATGWPEFADIELKWYSDLTMKTPLTFAADGNEINSTTTYYAAVLDKDVDALKEKLNYNLGDGWDKSGAGVRDSENNNLNDNTTMKGGSLVEYGTQTALSAEDGTATVRLKNTGYIVNARTFSVNEPIYFSYRLDSACDIDEDHWATREFQVGLFNSLTGALISHAQFHDNRYGLLGGFKHKVDSYDNLQAVPGYNGISSGVITNDQWGNIYDSGFNYVNKTRTDLKIVIGDENTVIYQIEGANEHAIMTMQGLNKKMFPNGVYIACSMTLLCDAELYAAQNATASVGTVANGSLTLDTAAAGTGLLAGSRVYFTATPDTGYNFTPNGLFANGVNIPVLTDTTDGTKYYFNLPMGVNEITIGWGIKVTFMADGKLVEAKDGVIGSTFNKFDAPEAPEKDGYQANVEWCTDEAGTTPFDFDNVTLSKPVTLYAKYTPREYTATLRDGSRPIGTVKANYDSAYAKPADPTKDGYEFKGWYADSEFTTEYNWDSKVTGNIYIYAKFEAVQSGGDNTGDNKPGDNTGDNTGDNNNNASTAQPEDKGCGCGGAVTASSVALAAITLVAAGAILLGKKKYRRD